AQPSPHNLMSTRWPLIRELIDRGGEFLDQFFIAIGDLPQSGSLSQGLRCISQPACSCKEALALSSSGDVNSEFNTVIRLNDRGVFKDPEEPRDRYRLVLYSHGDLNDDEELLLQYGAVNRFKTLKVEVEVAKNATHIDLGTMAMSKIDHNLVEGQPCLHCFYPYFSHATKRGRTNDHKPLCKQTETWLEQIKQQTQSQIFARLNSVTSPGVRDRMLADGSWLRAVWPLDKDVNENALSQAEVDESMRELIKSIPALCS
ncbi:MAG: hypothetical protein Q9159_007467, partial [Coniocarpon cinnabarinum]